MSQINTAFLYYIVLLFGAAFLGIYFWIIISATIPDMMIRMVFILTGFIVVASTVGIGTANIVSPDSAIRIIKEIKDYLTRHKINSLQGITGKAL